MKKTAWKWALISLFLLILINLLPPFKFLLAIGLFNIIRFLNSNNTGFQQISMNTAIYWSTTNWIFGIGIIKVIKEHFYFKTSMTLHSKNKIKFKILLRYLSLMSKPKFVKQVRLWSRRNANILSKKKVAKIM